MVLMQNRGFVYVHVCPGVVAPVTFRIILGKAKHTDVGINNRKVSTFQQALFKFKWNIKTSAISLDNCTVQSVCFVCCVPNCSHFRVG